MHRITLFVYGTLRQGGAAQEHMRGATWLASARTAPRYTLVRISWYPGVREGGNTSVLGDLYAVPPDQLPALDRFEGPEYVRGPVVMADGSIAEAYLLKPEHDHDYPPVPSGDWLAERF